MTKSELVGHIAQSAEVTKVQAEKMLGVFISAVVNETLSLGQSFTIAGLGTFKPQTSNARLGRNPTNGMAIQIPARTRLTFKMSSSLK